MHYPRGRILIFAKSPVPGTCKTRLGRDIGYSRAASVYRQLLIRNIEMAVTSNLAPVHLWCAPDTQHAFFLHCRRTWGLRLRRQARGDLGQRMRAALARSLKRCDYALIIGGDSPVLQADHLDDAFNALHEGDDCVFAPTTDGGYALVGSRSAPPRLFHNIDWSTPGVMPQTRLRLRRLDLTWTPLPMLWDVDERADYLRAKRLNLV